MPIKDTNRNIINIKIGDTDKKKKGKNRKRKMAQKSKAIGNFTYASSAPAMSQRPLHPQLPTTSHYNRAQEANLSTLIGAEQELQKSKEREKTLNSIIDNKLFNSTNNRSKNTPISHTKPTPLSPIPMSSPKSIDTPFNLMEKEKSLNDINIMMERSNKKADLLLQKEPSPIHNNSLYLSSDTEISPIKSNKRVTIMEEPKQEKEKREPKISLKELRKVIHDKGFPISYKDEEGKNHLFTKKELLERFDFVEIEEEKRENESKAKHKQSINLSSDDESYINSSFPTQNDISYFDTLPHQDENDLNSLFGKLGI